MRFDVNLKHLLSDWINVFSFSIFSVSLRRSKVLSLLFFKKLKELFFKAHAKHEVFTEIFSELIINYYNYEKFIYKNPIYQLNVN